MSVSTRCIIGEIPGSVFNSSPARPDDKVETVGVDHLIVALKSLSDSAVGAFVRELFAVRPSLAREVPNAAKIQKPDTDKDAAMPAHPGAAAYIDGTERTFLDKYSDYLWGGVLLLFRARVSHRLVPALPEARRTEPEYAAS